MSVVNYKNGKKIVGRARTLRQSGTVVEKVLWRVLRNCSDTKGVKFRYQHPLSRYVVDFVCLPAKLVVEIDGDSHDNSQDDDRERQDYIEKLGFEVLRFSNKDVMSDVKAVADAIWRIAESRLIMIQEAKSPPRKRDALSTLPQGEGG